MRYFGGIRLLSALAVLVAAPAVMASGTSSEDTKAIVDAVLTRQARLGAFRYEVTCQYDYTTAGRQRLGVPTGDRPPATLSFAFADGVMRVDIEDYVSSPYGWQRMPRSACISSELMVALHPDNNQGIVGPMGGWFREDPRMKALLFAHLLFTPLSSVRPEDLRLAGRAEHDGHPCVVLEQRYRREGTDYRKEWWLAEDMDYSVVMWQTFEDNKPDWQATIRYVPDEQAGWRVSSYRHVNRNEATGQVLFTIESQVTHAEFGLAPNPDEFRIVFPPGTMVSDWFRDTEYVAGAEGLDPTHALIDQGRMEEFVEKTREEMGSLDPRDRYRPRRWPWVAGGVGVLVLLAGTGGFILLLRRRRARRA